MSYTRIDANTIRVVVRFSTVPTTGTNACYCGSLQVDWGSGSQNLIPESTMTMTFTEGASTTIESGLVWKVPQRNDNGVNDPRVAHRFISKTGGQSCYPPVRFSMANYNTNSTVCGDGAAANGTSVIYPGNRCYYVAQTATGCPTGSTNCTSCGGSTAQCTVTAAPCS